MNGDWGLVIVAVVICLAWLSQWQRPASPVKAYQFRQQADLSYQDMILVGRQAAAFAETNYPHATIYGGFPESYQLTQPYQGYVTGELKFEWCENYKDEGEKDFLLYLHPYHPSQQACRQLLDQIKVIPVQKYVSNGAWIELYSNNATPSAGVR